MFKFTIQQTICYLIDVSSFCVQIAIVLKEKNFQLNIAITFKCYININLIHLHSFISLYLSHVF